MFLSFFKIYCHSRILAMLVIGIASGLPFALVSSTLKSWLAIAGIDRTTIGIFAMMSIPYSLKFLWAPCVDHIRIPFLTKAIGLRRSWLLVTQICLAGAIIMLGCSNPLLDVRHTALCALLVAFFSANQDIVIDAYRVEMLKDNEQGAGSASAVFGYRVGTLISGGGALLLVDYIDRTGISDVQFFSWSLMYSFMAILIFIGIIISLFLGEPHREVVDNANFRFIDRCKDAIVNPFLDFTKKDHWIAILSLVLLYKLCDAFLATMTHTFLIDVGFTLTEIGLIVKSFGFFATLIGSFVGGVIVYRMNIIKALFLGEILQMFSNASYMILIYVGHDPRFLCFSVGVENLCGGIGTSIFVAYLSSLCNRSYTATQYALLTSLASVGRTILSANGGWISEMFGWQIFFIFTIFSAVPALIMIHIIGKQHNTLDYYKS